VSFGWQADLRSPVIRPRWARIYFSRPCGSLNT
jgi:hypothetical protein